MKFKYSVSIVSSMLVVEGKRNVGNKRCCGSCLSLGWTLVLTLFAPC